LENIIERLVLTTEENIIFPSTLPPSIIGDREPDGATGSELEQVIGDEFDLKTVLEKVEKLLFTKAAKQCKSSYDIAKLLGISQPSVVRKMKKYRD